MAFLDSLQPDECAIVESYLETVFFPKGALILEQGSQGEGCYLIDKGWFVLRSMSAKPTPMPCSGISNPACCWANSA